MKLQIWEILGLVLGTALALKSVKAWLAATALLLGLFLATTSIGENVRHTIDQVTHQAPTSTTPTVPTAPNTPPAIMGRR